MKKVLLIVFLAFSSLFIFAGGAKAGPSIDQQYTGGGASLAISSKQRMAQRFLPSMTGLSKVEIELANVGSNQKVSVAIRHKTDLTWDTGSVASVNNQIATNGWNVFDFDDITVTKDGWYGIFVTADAGPQWKYNNGPSTYDRGYAIFDSNDYPDADFNFKTWGTEPVDIVADNTQPTDTVTPSTDGQTAGTGTAPATTTTTTIKAATGLKAEYVEAAGAVKLNWTKSATTDIDGYKVFRSESATANFKEIGKTVKTTIEYMDGVDITVGKTYYYFVRVYKGTDESASSSTVNITVPTPTTTVAAETPVKHNPILTMNLYDKGRFDDGLLFSTLIGSVGVLFLLLVWYEIRRAKKGQFLAGNHFKIEK